MGLFSSLHGRTATLESFFIPSHTHRHASIIHPNSSIQSRNLPLLLPPNLHANVMGNAVNTAAGAGGARKAKIMKINGEFFKLGTPAKVRDIIDNYPGHILLDSDEFRRFNLRARPLDPEFDLQPKKIYLLVELPRFPTPEEAENTPRPTSSGEILDETSQPPDNFGTSQRSADEAVRVKVKLPMAQVERILEQSSDSSEAAAKIIDLCMDDNGREAEEGERAVAPDADGEEDGERKGRWTEIGEDETTEKVSFSKCCVNLHPSLRIPYTNHHTKYKKLTSD